MVGSGRRQKEKAGRSDLVGGSGVRCRRDVKKDSRFLVSAAGKREVPVNLVGEDAWRSCFMGESRELDFGPVRFEMPCVRLVEPLDSVWMSVCLESRGRGHEHMDGTENCKNG